MSTSNDIISNVKNRADYNDHFKNKEEEIFFEKK